MGHITSKSHLDLQKRLEKSPQGAPASDSLFKILEILFTEDEALLVCKLPIKFFSIAQAAKIWKKSEKEAHKILDELADKGLLLDLQKGKRKDYILAPTMAGFFEFSLMRTDGKFDRKVLSELYYQYINVEDGFVKEVLGLKPEIARTLVHEDQVKEYKSIILDYERASKVIDTATCITVGTCYCRHKMEHMNKACSQPQDVCLTFNNAAKSLSKHGIAKKISKAEAHKILDRCIKLGLVQIGDNVQEGVSWICNCCGCCCEAILAYKHLGRKMNLTSNFYASCSEPDCTGCGFCIKKCPVDAIKKKGKVVDVDKAQCIGCGVCARFCPTKALSMGRRSETGFVPKDAFERFVVGAINEGKLQNLIFDNYSLWTHTMLRQLLGVLFKLPPAKWILMNQQLRSRFLDNAIKAYSKINKDLKPMLDEGKLDYTHPELKK